MSSNVVIMKIAHVWRIGGLHLVIESCSQFCAIVQGSNLLEGIYFVCSCLPIWVHVTHNTRKFRVDMYVDQACFKGLAIAVQWVIVYDHHAFQLGHVRK